MNMLSPILLKMSAGGGPFMPLYWLFGKCMHFLLEMLSNEYFLAIILFTVLTRLVLLPINIRQQKTTAKSARIQPKIQKIQKKYNIRAISDPKQRQKMQAKMNEALFHGPGHGLGVVGLGSHVGKGPRCAGGRGPGIAPEEVHGGAPGAGSGGVKEDGARENGGLVGIDALGNGPVDGLGKIRIEGSAL